MLLGDTKLVAFVGEIKVRLLIGRLPRFPDGLAGPAFQSDHLDLDTKHEVTIRPMRRGLNEESIVFGEIRLFSFQVLDKLLIGSMIAKDWGKCDKTDGSWI